MLPDMHTHTALCKHARGRPRDYAETARTRGVPAVGCTDHIPVPDGYDPACRMDRHEMDTYRAWVREAQGVEGVTVLYGIEADYYPGCERYLPDFLASERFDLVLGSIHYLGDWAFDNPATLARWESADVTAVWRAYFELLDGLVASGWFDVVGHLDLPKKFGHRPPDRVVREMAAPVLDRVARGGMAIELNTGGLRKPVAEIYPSPLILAMARAREIPICFGSDAHSPTYVAHDFGAAREAAREAGYREYVQFRERRMQRVPLPADGE